MSAGELQVLRSRETVAADLRAIGVEAGHTVLVHASLRSVGYVLGGATAVVQALLDAVDLAGTVVAPSYTPENRDPSRWTDPVVPSRLWPQVRANIPAFDRELTPSRGVGVVAERVRTWPGAVRSGHPQTSFAAIGRRAVEVTARHELESPLGEQSPLARLEAAGAYVLLLGVGYSRCTAFHLAEYRLTAPPMRQHGCAMWVLGERLWRIFDSVALDAGDFAALGANFDSSGAAISHGQVGDAPCRYFPIVDAVGFAHAWLTARR